MFKLPEEVKKEAVCFRHSLNDLKEGKISPARFKGMRVPWGIYSHRGGKVFMMRIRVPAGMVTPLQLKALAEASHKWGNGLLHITTRQDIQIHNLKIEDTIEVMEYLQKYNLSPRGGGGNTVRNIIACPLSGICKDEVFDLRGYATAATEYLLREETSFKLPRKFKISFSGCAKDCAGCMVNDLGFVAKRKNGREGFKVFAGGGMGAEPRLGRLLEEFTPVEDLGYYLSAVKNVFYRRGDRRNKHHNRLRFLIEDIGFEEFSRLYKEELRSLKEKGEIALRKIDLPQREGENGEVPQKGGKAYEDFLKYNVNPQKQKGFSAVALRIPRGDITAKELTALADLEREFPGIEFRTSQDQNLFLCWLKNGALDKIFSKLKDSLGDFLYPVTLLDPVACKGALTCNLGLCNSPGLAKEIEKMVREKFTDKKVFAKLGIRLNGCPNACAQQPIGKLSFYGLARKVDNRPVPFYKFLIGGRKKAEFSRLAGEVGIIPARNIPAFLCDYLTELEEKIKEGDGPDEFLNGPAREIAKGVLENYAYVPPYSENRSFYIDWGREEDFSLAGLGPGECGAGVLDVIEADLTDAKFALEEAQKQGYAYEHIRKALLFSARSLLVVRGKDPRNEAEVFDNFKEVFLDRGIASGRYLGLREEFAQIDDKLPLEIRKEKYAYAEQFLKHINELYKSMDPAFNFPEIKEKKEEGFTPLDAYFMDLKGTPCPINYVKVKLRLEGLNSGDKLEVLLDGGEPIENVPKSLESDGHQILKIEKQDGFFKVLVRKK